MARPKTAVKANGDYVKYLREELGITQEELLGFHGVTMSEKTLQRIEASERVGREFLQELADALETPIELLTDTEVDRNELRSLVEDEGADAILFLRQMFDRECFKVPMQHEEPISFISAIRAVRVAMTTGVITNSQGQALKSGRGKSYIKNRRIARLFEEVFEHLLEIEFTWSEHFENNPENVRGWGYVSYDDDYLRKMDAIRNEIIKRLNLIYGPLGYLPFPDIIPPNKRGRGYAPGPLRAVQTIPNPVVSRHKDD